MEYPKGIEGAILTFFITIVVAFVLLSIETTMFKNVNTYGLVTMDNECFEVYWENEIEFNTVRNSDGHCVLTMREYIKKMTIIYGGTFGLILAAGFHGNQIQDQFKPNKRNDKPDKIHPDEIWS